MNDLGDFVKIRKGWIQAELGAFISMPEVISFYSDTDGAEHYLAVERNKPDENQVVNKESEN